MHTGMAVPRDDWNEATDTSRALASLHADRRDDDSHRAHGQPHTQSANPLASTFPCRYTAAAAPTWAEHPVQGALFGVFLCRTLFLVLPAHQEQLMTTPACSRALTVRQGESKVGLSPWVSQESLPASRPTHEAPWSQFLLQSVTMGTEFSSEPQGVNQFTSHSLSEKNDDLGIYLEIEEWNFFSFI